MIKSFKQFLSEMPLPTDWDSTKMGGRNSFASQLRYAQQRAKKVGAGSSRVAFVIPYQGRSTVLKIAKNKRGLIQNEFEAEMLSDSYLENLKIAIPMIDYDENSPEPAWIHTELAKKVTPTDFVKFFGMSLPKMVYGAQLIGGLELAKSDMDKEWLETTLEKLYEDNDTFSSFVQLITNYTNIPIGDFTRIANWGIFNNHPVIVDIGISNDIVKQYYR